MNNKNKIPVCYKEFSTNIIKWDNVVEVEKVKGKNPIIRFEDGGWNPADECFFTELQCRKYHELPPQDWTNETLEIANKLNALVESIHVKNKIF